MKKSIIILLAVIFTFQLGNSQITKAEKEKLASFKVKIDPDFDIVAKIDKLTTVSTFQTIETLLSNLDIVHKIEYARNEFGEITNLKFECETMMCSSDDFGVVFIAVKDKNVVSCGAADFSYIVREVVE